MDLNIVMAGVFDTVLAFSKVCDFHVDLFYFVVIAVVGSVIVFNKRMIISKNIEELK